MRNLLIKGSTDMPLQVRYFFDQKIADMMSLKIAQLDPDVIYAQLIRMVPYALALDTHLPMLLDYMDSMKLNDLAGQFFDKGFRKFLKNRERRLIGIYETKAAPSFKAKYVISDRDKVEFDSLVQPEIKLLPNGVDVSYYSPVENVKPSYDLGFCGNLSYHPNKLAVNEVLELMGHSPSWTCRIAGAEASEALLEKGDDQVHIDGFIEDIRDLYHSVRLFVAPIYTGSGIQNKILEAMACRRVCVTTTFVNESIKAPPDRGS